MKYILPILILISSFVYSNDSLDSLFSSHPEHVLSGERYDDFHMGGVVNPISGNFCLRQIDLIAIGAENVALKRVFIPYYTPLKSKKKPKPSKEGYAGWAYFPHTRLNVFASRKNHKTDTKVCFADSNGVVFIYNVENGKTVLHSEPWGVCNGICETPSGRYDHRNVRIQFKKKFPLNVIVNTHEGIERHYEFYKEEQVKIEKKVYTNFFCLLRKEILQNGKILRYSYDIETKCLIKVESLDPQEKHVYASINLECYPNRPLAKFSTHTGIKTFIRHNTEHFYKKCDIDNPLNLFCPLNITVAETPFFKEEIQNFQNKDFLCGDKKRRHTCLTSYIGQNHDFKCSISESVDVSQENLKPTYQKRRKRHSTQRIKDLFLPGNEDALEQAFSFKYELSIPGYREGKSIVTHQDGSTTIFAVNSNMLPTSIKFSDPYGQLKKEKLFEWNKNQWLKSIVIKASANQILSKKTFQYDTFGNPIVETFEGDLTGNGSYEAYTIKREYSKDGKHLLLKEESEDGMITEYTYVQNTNLLKTKKVKERCNLITSEEREYDDCLNLIKITEEDASSKTKKITAFTLKDTSPFLHMPAVVEESYEENGILFPLVRTVLHYDQYGKICEEIVYDANNQFRYSIKKDYDERGSLRSFTNALGHKTTYSYEKHGWLETETTPKKLTSTFYDRKGRKKQVRENGVNGVIHKELYEYNHDDCLIKKRDTFNLETTYFYDSFNDSPSRICYPSLYTKTGETPVIETFSYDSLGRCTISTNPRNNSKQTTYNAYGSPVEIIYADESIESFRYTKSGLLERHTHLNGLTTYYTYDSLGRMTTKQYEFGNKCLAKEIFEYQGKKLIKWTDQENRITEYTYDGAGRKISEVVEGYVSTYAYDSLGRLSTTQEENGKATLITCYEYDDLDQLTSKICKDSSGAILTIVHYTYDFEGNLETIKKNINGKEAVETFSYDSQNRIISVEDALRNITTTEYDEISVNSFGQQVLKKRVIEPNKAMKIETFDPYGRLAKKETLSPEGKIISSEEKVYDPCGNLSLQMQYVYEGSQYITTKITAYENDSLDRQVSFTRAYQTPQERVTRFTYYPDGKVKTKTKPDGTELSYAYDPFGNIKQLVSSDGTIRHNFVYNTLGHLKKATDEVQNMEITRECDSFGNVTLETFFTGLSIAKTYDLLNRPLKVTLPNNSSIRYTYDPLFCKCVERLSATGEVLYTHQYDAYDLNGNLATETLIKNGGKRHHKTDLKNRISNVDSPHFTQQCHYDSVNNLIQLTECETTTYAYDLLNQLTSENYPDSSRTYVHDSAWNRVKQGLFDRKFNALDELEETKSEKFQYDLNGNLSRRITSEGSIDYQYDALNRLTAVDSGDTKITFLYDPLGRKLVKTKLQTTGDSWEEFSKTFYLYDGNCDIGSLDASGKIKDLRITGITKNLLPTTIALELEEKLYTPIQDTQGNTRKLLDSISGMILAKNDFSAFGELLNTSSGPFDPWRYHAKRFDPDINLIDYGKRFYCPNLGRWMSTDPAGFMDTMNLYAYLRNNPFKFSDPDGQFAFAIPLIIGTFCLGGEITIGVVTTEIVAAALVAVIYANGHSEGINLVREFVDVCSESAEAQTKETETKKKRNSPPLPDPKAEGNPHTRIEKPGKTGQYTTHNGDGTFKQYRGEGKPHGNIPRPNIKENKNNPTKNGPQLGKPEYREPRTDEIPNLT
jgi:RHS repeat-associated protein